MDNVEARLVAIKDVINRMPVANATNLRYLIRFLAKLVENQFYTKMSAQNLAIVLAPNILWNPNNKARYEIPILFFLTIDSYIIFQFRFVDNACSSTLVDCLISNADYFFPGGFIL